MSFKSYEGFLQSLIDRYTKKIAATHVKTFVIDGIASLTDEIDITAK